MNDVTNQVFFRLADQPMPDDFSFIKFKQKELSGMASNALQQPRYLLEGREETFAGPARLAVNLFIFANMGFNGHEGSATMQWLLSDRNTRFAPSGVGIIYHFLQLFQLGSNKHINDLLNQFDGLDTKAYKSGRLMLIAVPKESIDNNVFTVIFRKSGSRRTQLNLAGRSLHTMSDVVQEIQRHPESIPFEKLHEFECAIPYRGVGLLNPYSGIKIYSFDPQPENVQAFKELERTKAELVDAIMRELERSGKLEQAKKIAKDRAWQVAEIASRQ